MPVAEKTETTTSYWDALRVYVAETWRPAQAADVVRLILEGQVDCTTRTVDTKRSDAEGPLERFLTLDIDTQAQQAGYSPCASHRQPADSHA